MEPDTDESQIVWPDRHTPPAEGELDQLGFSTTRKCPVCGAGLYWSTFGLRPNGSMICLNACHLGRAGSARFHAHMTKFILDLEQKS